MVDDGVGGGGNHHNMRNEIFFVNVGDLVDGYLFCIFG